MRKNINGLKEEIKKAYEASIRAESKEVSDILFNCITLVSRLTDEDSEKDHKIRHRWEEIDALVAFYLAKKYDDLSEFKSDLMTKKLLEVRPTVALGSLQMAVQNFYSLLGKERGLTSVSRLAKRVYDKYKKTSLNDMRIEIENLIKKYD